MKLLICGFLVFGVVCLSGCNQDPPPWTQDLVDLGVVMQQQEAHEWCWAAVAQSVANWHGEVFSQSDIVSISFGRPCTIDTCDAAYRPSKIFDLIGIKEIGLTSTWTQEDLWKNQLEKQHLIKLVLTNGNSNHMVLIGGYNPDGFYLYDPSSLYKGVKQTVKIEDLNTYPKDTIGGAYHVIDVSFLVEK